MSNFIKLYIRDALYFTAYLMITGTIIQTFLTELGISGSNVGVFVTIISLTNVIGSMLFSSIADNSNQVIKTNSKLLIIIGITIFAFVPFCIFINFNIIITFILVLIIGILQSLFMAIKGVFDYKIPYLVIPMEKYNILIGVSNTITGIIGILFSLIMLYFINKYPYFNLMLCMFIFGALLMFASAFINSKLKQIDNKTGNNPRAKLNKRDIINLFKNPLFKKFIIANFVRGITMGIVGIAAVIGFHDNILNSVTASYLVTAAMLAHVIGSFLYTVLTKYIGNTIIGFCGSLMPIFLLLMSSKSVTVYIIGYFIASLGLILIGIAIPYRVYEMIPFEIIGMYNTWRLILTTLGVTFSTVITGYAINYIPSFIIFIIGIVCLIFCGIQYFRPTKKAPD